MAARKPTKKKKKAPAKKKKTTKPAARILPVPESKDEVLAWFSNLAARIERATTAELQGVVAEARKYDLVGLSEALGAEIDVLSLNHAANDLIEAAIIASKDDGDRRFQLQVLRDILNDS